MVKIVYMGTPAYAVPALRRLANMSEVEVSLVVTQPDRPQGRGRTLQSPPVKHAADELHVPTLQTGTLKDPEARARLGATQPDLIVVAAFGLILGPKTLTLPPLGCVNLHASILPAYRGANPIAAAIAMGEQQTGVTLMAMDRGLDTGDIIAVRELPIDRTSTTATLTEALAEIGADLLEDTLAAIVEGDAIRTRQDGATSLTRPMVKNDGWVDWTRPAIEVDQHVRAMTPWPGAWSTFADGERLLIHRVSPSASTGMAHPGELILTPDVVLVGCGSGAVRIDSAQLPGGKPLFGRSLVERMRHRADEVLDVQSRPEVPGPLVTRIDA